MSNRELRQKFIPIQRQRGGNVAPPIMIASKRTLESQKSATQGHSQLGSRKLNRTERVIEAAKNLLDVQDNANMQKKYMDTLCNYCVLEKNYSKKFRYRTAALENGFGEACSLILSVQIDNKVTVKRALRCLTMGGTPMQVYQHIMKHKVHERAFEALLKYYDDVVIAEVALSAFTSLAECPAFVQYLYIAKVKGEDFTSLLCRILIKYRDDRMIQIFGCSLITTLLAGAERELRKKLIFHFGLLDLTIAAMRRFQASSDPSDHHYNSELQSKAVFALLYAYEHFYFQMVKGVPKIMLDAHSEHYSNSKLMSKFSQVFGRLAESKESAICFYHNGIISKLKRSCLYSIIKLNEIKDIQDETVLRRGADLIENIIGTTRLLAKLLNYPEIFLKYVQSDGFEQDIDFLAKLLSCRYLKGFQKTGDEMYGVSTRLRESLQHLMDKSVKIGEWAAYLVCTILMKNSEVVEKLVRKHFWNSILRLADFFKNNVGIQIKMVKAIAELAKKSFPPPPPLKEENAQEEADLNPKRFENSLYAAEGLDNALHNAQYHFENEKATNRALTPEVKMQLIDLMEKAKESAV